MYFAFRVLPTLGTLGTFNEKNISFPPFRNGGCCPDCSGDPQRHRK